MNRKTLLGLVGVFIMGVLISSLISNALFNPSAKRSVSVPVVQPINSSFPDVKTDSTLSSVFNTRALDPTQLIQIGPSQNASPFNSATQ